MAYRDYATLNNNSTNQPSSISGYFPGSAVAGDTVLICTVASTGVDTQTIASTGPTAPTLLRGRDVVGSNVTAYLWKVTLASGDVGATVTVSGTSGHYFVGAMLAFSGRDSGTPVYAEGTATSTTSLASPTVTTTADLADVAFFYVARSATASWPSVTVPSTQTKATEAHTANSASPNFNICGAYRTTPGAAGIYGGSTATSSQTATGAVLYTVGLAPASTTSLGFQLYKVNTGGTTSRLSLYLVNSGGTTTQIASSTD